MNSSAPAAPSPSQLLTVRDVAALLRIHPRSVWRMSASGQLPAPLALGAKTIRWRAADIEAYLTTLAGQAAKAVTP
jgi:excisionase family DNA binding protein